MRAPALQSYQRAILAFFDRRKDENDRVLLWNGHLRWKSEVDTAPKPPPAAPIRGFSANVLIIDEPADFPLDSLPKPSTIPPCQSTHQPVSPNLSL